MPVYRQCTVIVEAFACLWNVGLNINGKKQMHHLFTGRVWPKVQTQVFPVVRQRW